MFFLLFRAQELGLQPTYQEDHGTYYLIKTIMALLFLPPHEITGMFVQLEATGLLQLFANYIRNTWIDSQLWPQSCWTVFMKAVRTNSNTEGWHHALNRRAEGKTQLPLYLLIQLLHQEARLISLQIRLVTEKKRKKVQRKTYRMEEYKAGEGPRKGI